MLTRFQILQQKTTSGELKERQPQLEKGGGMWTYTRCKTSVLTVTVCAYAVVVVCLSHETNS